MPAMSSATRPKAARSSPEQPRAARSGPKQPRAAKSSTQPAHSSPKQPEAESCRPCPRHPPQCPNEVLMKILEIASAQASVELAGLARPATPSDEALFHHSWRLGAKGSTGHLRSDALRPNSSCCLQKPPRRPAP
eukprot:4447994-Alexandrium_andersonii.AAC.1